MAGRGICVAERSLESALQIIVNRFHEVSLAISETDGQYLFRTDDYTTTRLVTFWTRVRAVYPGSNNTCVLILLEAY